MPSPSLSLAPLSTVLGMTDPDAAPPPASPSPWLSSARTDCPSASPSAVPQAAHPQPSLAPDPIALDPPASVSLAQPPQPSHTTLVDPLKTARGIYLTVHGHFYQPPRENPYLESIERQAGAEPFHNWNERIYWECYRPNAFARILGETGEIVEIVNNFEYLRDRKSVV